MQFFIDNFPLLRDAFLTTLSLSLLAGLLALVLGTLLAAFRVSPITPLRGLATFYVETFRNTPLTVVFFFIIFGLPQVDFAVGFFTGAVLSVGLYTAAFVCEAVRSGINAVSPGQAEASRALGLTFGQSLREVVLPQAFRTVVPPLGNVWIAMVKNTSIAAGFAVTELTASLQRLSNANGGEIVLVLLAVVIGYMLITLPSAYGIGRIERRVAILR
ncbi:MAG: Polar amino acid transporter, inner rane subunit [Modestobacter sp.]|nr:Polar amino acid transporter, inner rane subunit [Modestobacter sp.]